MHNSLIPELSVSNIQKSLQFYCDILDFKIEYQRPESKFAFLFIEEAQIMIQEINDTWNVGKLEKPFGRGINLEIEVNKITPLLNSLKKHKYPLFKNVMENWYRKDKKFLGNKEFLVQDPDGYLLRFCEDLGEKKLT